MATTNQLNAIFAMSFSEFAEAVKPSGAVNRFPVIGPGADMYSYSIYMNGPVAKTLPEHVQEHTFKDVTLHALTEKLQLNAGSARDNLKVAELVALRGAWMSAVLEASVGQGDLPDRVMEDYSLLTEGMTHPWIAAELTMQKALSAKLPPSLARAGITKDVIPHEVSVGKVVGQDTDFTIQKTTDGEVVTHENRRLNTLPAVGSEVMVSYYRGSGQVVNSLENVKVSEPYIDPVSEDLGVMLDDGAGASQLVLFNSIAGFDKFVKAHGLDTELVRKAMDVLEAAPKLRSQIPLRELVRPPYIDAHSGCLAIDYKEEGVQYSALFGSARVMASLAHEFGLGAKAVAMAESLEMGVGKQNSLAQAGGDKVLNANLESALRADLKQQGFEKFDASNIDGRYYMGKIVAVGPLHVAQDLGRGVVAIHDTRTLDKVAALGDRLTVKYQEGRGQVTDMVKSSKDLGR